MILSATIKALRGHLLWLRAKRKYKIAEGGIYVLMLPDSDNAFNEYALRHVDDFLDFRKGTSAVIFTTDEWVEKNAVSYSNRISAVEKIPQRHYCYYYYYYYYCDYYFSNQFILMSLQGGYGKRLSLAIGKNGITKEDLACLGLYIIRNWNGAEMQNG